MASQVAKGVRKEKQRSQLEENPRERGTRPGKNSPTLARHKMEFMAATR